MQSDYSNDELGTSWRVQTRDFNRKRLQHVCELFIGECIVGIRFFRNLVRQLAEGAVVLLG